MILSIVRPDLRGSCQTSPPTGRSRPEQAGKKIWNRVKCASRKQRLEYTISTLPKTLSSTFKPTHNYES